MASTTTRSGRGPRAQEASTCTSRTPLTHRAACASDTCRASPDRLTNWTTTLGEIMTDDRDAAPFEHFGFGVPWEDAANYAQAVRAGDLLFISGQLAHDADGNLLGEGDFSAQAEATWANMDRVLQRFGAQRSDIVDVTVYVVDLRTNFEATTAAGRGYFAEHRPAVTVVGIEALAFPTQLIEISATAVLRGSRQ